LHSARIYLLKNDKEFLLLGIIIILSLVVRFLAIDKLLANLICDECDNMGNIYQIIYSKGPGIFGLDWKPQPAFSVYLMSVFVRIFGESVLGLRSASIILSTIALIFFYFLCKRAMSQGAALAATFILSFNSWYLHFSRSGWENIHICLYELIAFLSIEKALETKKWRYYVTGAIGIALGLYGYFAGIFIIPSVMLYFLFVLRYHRTQWLRVIAGFLLMFILVLILFLPQGISIIKQWKYFNRRPENVFVFNQKLPYMDKDSWTGVIIENAKRNIMTLYDGTHSNNPRYFPPREPLFDKMSCILIFTGMFLSLYAWRKSALWWCIFLPHFFIQIITVHTPDGARGIAMVPVFFFFAGLAIDQFKNTWYGFWQQKAPITLIAICIFTAWFNINKYKAWFSSQNALDMRHPAVLCSEFDDWQTVQIYKVKSENKPINVEAWLAHKDELIQEALNNREFSKKQVSEEKKEDTQKQIEELPIQLKEPEEIVPEELLTIQDESPQVEEPENKTPIPIIVSDTESFDHPADFDEHGNYLIAKCFATIDWSGEPTHTIKINNLRIPDMKDIPNGIIYTGYLLPKEAGKKLLELCSDDGSYLYLDEKLVIDNGGHHPERKVQATYDFEQKPYKFMVKYFQDGGAYLLRLLWGEPTAKSEELVEIPNECYLSDIKPSDTDNRN